MDSMARATRPEWESERQRLLSTQHGLNIYHSRLNRSLTYVWPQVQWNLRLIKHWGVNFTVVFFCRARWEPDRLLGLWYCFLQIRSSWQLHNHYPAPWGPQEYACQVQSRWDERLSRESKSRPTYRDSSNYSEMQHIVFLLFVPWSRSTEDQPTWQLLMAGNTPLIQPGWREKRSRVHVTE